MLWVWKPTLKRVNLEGFLRDIFIHTLPDVNGVCGTDCCSALSRSATQHISTGILVTSLLNTFEFV